MKRYDLEDGEKAFVYGTDSAVDKLSLGALKFLHEVIAKSVVPLLEWLKEKIYHKTTHGILIVHNDEGKVYTMFATSKDVKQVREMLEFTLEKTREAEKREAH